MNDKRDKRSALDTLSAAEKATVLDELLAARPDLREPAEAYAIRVMTDADRLAVANDVEWALQGLDIEELNTRAGHRSGRGYVHPAEAADPGRGPATVPRHLAGASPAWWAVPNGLGSPGRLPWSVGAFRSWCLVAAVGPSGWRVSWFRSRSSGGSRSVPGLT